MTTLKRLVSQLKPYLRWLILGGTLFFLGKVLKDHWQEAAALRLSRSSWVYLAMALAVTLLAHVWCGWVWSWILREFHQPASGMWGIRTYLKTNIAKYLPGNVWHFYGRVWAAKAAGFSLAAATLSVLMEPLLMAAAALTISLIGYPFTNRELQGLALAIGLVAVHPRFLNSLLRYLNRAKSADDIAEPALQLRRYPLLPLLGELSFVALRGAGFLLTLLALQPMQSSSLAGGIALEQIPLVLSVFSFAWLLGLVIPGAPGGLGVFEATTIALLAPRFSPGSVLSLVALYRLVSILAEAGGAVLAWLSERVHRADTPDDYSGS